jgi:hypothetical protein
MFSSAVFSTGRRSTAISERRHQWGGPRPVALRRLSERQLADLAFAAQATHRAGGYDPCFARSPLKHGPFSTPKYIPPLKPVRIPLNQTDEMSFLIA